MIELLLQAERSLAMGSLEQAERLYWQAIDADSQNAIAIVGLAKVARERGDDRTAIAFGRRALQVDAEDAVARRLVAELEAAHPAATQPAVAVAEAVVEAGPANDALSAGTADDPTATPSGAAPGTAPKAGDGWPTSDGRPAADPTSEARRPARSDVEWPAADLKQVCPPDGR
jgi:tetratricopeptide (TPR) repeat protein